jgi:hypothetical protein
VRLLCEVSFLVFEKGYVLSECTMVLDITYKSFKLLW